LSANAPAILGIDFSSAPKRDKPIVVAHCENHAFHLLITNFSEFRDWPAFELWLSRPDAWVAGFDFPFGLPRRYVDQCGFGQSWTELVTSYPSQGKEEFAARAMAAFMAAQVPQDKHRQTDLSSGSHSPLKTKTNPPVGLMFYEGAWRLHKCDVSIPRLRETESGKIALEAYPGLLARRLGIRLYKNDTSASSADRIAARKSIISELQRPSANTQLWIPKPVKTSSLIVEKMLHSSGDWLDAVLCAVQAAWGYERRSEGYGLPQNTDPVEGWIVSA